MKIHVSQLLAAASLVLAIPSGASAQLAGETLRAQYIGFTPETIVADFGTAVVGAGPEFNSFNRFALDFDDNSLSVANTAGDIVFFSAAAFNGWRFFDEFGALPALSSISIDASTQLIGFDASRILLGDGLFSLNLQGIQFREQDRLRLNLVFDSHQVPEPTPAMLLFAGLVIGGVAVRRRRQVTN